MFEFSPVLHFSFFNFHFALLSDSGCPAGHGLA
jgi:hypothetical protein